MRTSSRTIRAVAPRPRLLLALGLLATSACGGGASAHGAHVMNAAPAPPIALDAGAERDVARARVATASFRTLDSAAVAGYPREVRACLSDPAQGGMGFHHLNRALLDDKVDIERPEILLYSRTASGEYHLNGVEYIVLYSARSRDAQPLMVMGQQMKRSDSLKIWYLHVWLWEPNSSGLFADYNPVVKC